MNSPDVARQWWTRLEQFLVCQGVAELTRIWPVKQALDHGNAGKHHERALSFARKASIVEEYELARLDEAASYIVAVIKVRHLSSALQYEVSELQADNPQVLEEQLLDIKARHAESQVRLHELDQSGYDLELDTLTYDLLNTHFEDVPALLKTIWKQECISLEVDYGGRKCPMSISSFKGRVTVNLHFDNLFWNSEHLWYPAGKLKELRQNAVLSDYIAHPVFANRPILKIESGLHDLVSFDLSDRMLFDAESASVWSSTRLAA